jgi:geranylgeranyl pyrophosphate synthase
MFDFLFLERYNRDTGAEKNGKKTFVSFHGIDEAKKIASEMTREAISAISEFPNNKKLVELAELLLNRQV